MRKKFLYLDDTFKGFSKVYATSDSSKDSIIKTASMMIIIGHRVLIEHLFENLGVLDLEVEDTGAEEAACRIGQIAMDRRFSMPIYCPNYNRFVDEIIVEYKEPNKEVDPDELLRFEYFIMDVAGKNYLERLKYTGKVILDEIYRSYNIG